MELTEKKYKATEVGLLPEDWTLEPIKDFASITTGGSDTQDRVADGAYPFYVRSNTIERINKYSFDGEAILTSGDGVGVGKIFHHVTGKFDFHQRVYNIHNYRENVDGKYLFFQFSSKFYDRVMSMTAKSSVDSVRREMIADMLIPLPSTIEEQKVISKALSDIEELLEKMENLIEKKIKIKHGVMQQILIPEEKGGKKLSGFRGEWLEMNLGKLCTYINDGTHHTPTYTKRGIPFYSVESVSANDFQNVKYISKAEHEKLIRRCKPEKGDILMTRIGTLGLTKLITWDVDASIYVSLALIKVNDLISSKYLHAYTKSSQFISGVLSRSLLNATPQKINMAEIAEIPIQFPSCKDEQIAVANVLDDMDAEIEELLNKKLKYQNIKQGMMQELLTGKTRLV